MPTPDRSCPAVVNGDTAFISFVDECLGLLCGSSRERIQHEVSTLLTDFAATWRMPDARYRQLQPEAPYASYMLFLNKAATFNGAALTATLETKEQTSQAGGTLYVDSIRPIIESVDNPTVTVSIGSRKTTRDNVNYTIPKTLNSTTGEANIRKDARYLRYQVTIDGGFDHAVGVVPNPQETEAQR